MKGIRHLGDIADIFTLYKAEDRELPLLMADIRHQWYRDALCDRLNGDSPPFCPRTDMRDTMYVYNTCVEKEWAYTVPVTLETLLRDKREFDLIHQALFILMLTSGWDLEITDLHRDVNFDKVLIRDYSIVFVISGTRLDIKHYNTVHIPRFEFITDLKHHQHYPLRTASQGKVLRWWLGDSNNLWNSPGHDRIKLGAGVEDSWKRPNKSKLKKLRLV